MIEIEEQVTEEWMNPPDGFNDDLEEDDDQKIIKVGMDFIDRLIVALGKEIMLKFVSDFVVKMLN